MLYTTTSRASLALLAATITLWPTFALAQLVAANTNVPDDQLVVLTYDVTDLILEIRDHCYSDGMSGHTQRGGIGGLGGGYGGGGASGGFFSVPNPQMGAAGGGGLGGVSGMDYTSDADARPTIDMDSLVAVVMNIVAPETWSAVGGAGQIEPLGTTLVVRHSPAVHEQIKSLLDQLRKGSGSRATVSIDARWLLLNSDDLDKLTAAGSEQKEIDRKVLAEFTRRPSSIRGLTHCFSGQLVYLVSGTRQSVVRSFVPVVGSAGRPEQFGAQFAATQWPAVQQFAAQGTPSNTGNATMLETSGRSVGYQPVVDNPNFGTLLEIRPTLIPSDNGAIVDLRSTITVPGQSIIATPQPTNASGMPPVDRVAIDTQVLATTLRVPLGKPMLVGGLTYVAPASLVVTPPDTAGRAADSAEQAEETPQLYLLLELRSGDAQ